MQMQYPAMGGFPPPNQYQPRYMDAPKPMPQPMQNMQWIPVNGIEGAKAHMVQPNVTAWLMDNNEPFFYVKSADALGVTTLKTFKFEEVHIENEQRQDFVSREEFSKFTAQIEDILKEVISHGKSADGNDAK